MPLLPVIGAVREADAGAGEDEKAANPQRRRRIALGRLVERRVLDHRLHDEQQHGGQYEADNRRQQERLSDLDSLAPIDAGGAVSPAQQRVGHADADDRPDYRVRTRSRQAEPPGAEVPDDRRDQQREHHGKTGAAADLKDKLDRKQRYDPERHRAAGEGYPEKIEEARPQHGDLRRQ
jgi:hypothetical protein